MLNGRKITVRIIDQSPPPVCQRCGRAPDVLYDEIEHEPGWTIQCVPCGRIAAPRSDGPSIDRPYDVALRQWDYINLGPLALEARALTEYLDEYFDTNWTRATWERWNRATQRARRRFERRKEKGV